MTRSYTKFVKRLESIGLRADVEKRALANHVSLRDLYKGGEHEPSIIAARKSVYAWLKNKKGRGNNEIARLFDRSNSSISKMTRNGG